MKSEIYEPGAKSEKAKEELVEITPKKDHVVMQNKYHYDLKVGVKASVAKHFIPALKTEKVID